MTDDDRPEHEPEGVRILGAEEAAEVMGRDDVARRRRPDEPRPGDRPETPDADAPEPVLRFPLSSGSGSGDELPHWTEPPSGGTIFDGPDAEASGSWSPGGAAPRWRDEEADWTGEVEAIEERGGALDDDRPDPEDFFRFDEIDEGSDARSVFGDVDDTYYADDEDEFGPLPDDSGPRKIVVGGGRVEPGTPPGALPPRAHPGVGADRNIGQAAIVGAGLLVVAGVMFLWGPAPAAWFVTVVVAAAAAELLTRLREVGYQPAALLGLAATAGMVIATYYRGEQAIPVVMTLAVAFSMIWYLAGAGDGQATLNIGVTLFTVGWVGLFGSFATAMLSIGDAGKGILFGAILATVAYDVGGYFVGRSAGRAPLSQASPNKTVEGLLGGCVAALTVAIIYGFLSEPFGSLGDGLSLGVAVAIAAPIGDLCQSRIKRDMGVKDMGTILPGHGGLMDRFDAMLFVLPTVYYVAKLSDFFL